MPVEIRVPILGENVDSAVVSKVLVKVGDTIAKDQSILELETDKAAVDLPSSDSGRLKSVEVKEGDTVKVGQLVMTLEDNGTSKKPAASPQPAKPSTPQAPPATAASKQPEPPAAQPTSPSPSIPASPSTSPPTSPSTSPPALGVPPESPASPALRRMARELGVEIRSVKGTGPEGRITEEDIRNRARDIIQGVVPHAASGAASHATLPDFSRWGEVERHPLAGVRRKSAEHVRSAWSSIPHVTQFETADITELDKTRLALSKTVDAAGGKLTITAIALKVVASALKAFPKFNVSFDEAAGEVISKKYVHIGVAVETDHGLFVPVIRNVDRKNIRDLSIELGRVAESARNRKLTIEDMQGGSFTITNLGGIGGAHFTPIINSPEAAILGISRATLQPAVIDGQVQPRLMMPLSLSYDHRVIDGADGARFLRWVAEAFAQPFRVLLEG